MIRLIATDLDDTLLNERGEVSERTRAALTRAAKTGCRIVICTGRMVRACEHFMKEFSPDGWAICLNGALWHRADTGETHIASVLSEETGMEILRDARARNEYVQSYDMVDFFYEKACEKTREYSENIRIQGIETGRPLCECVKGPFPKLLIIGQEDTIEETHAYYSKKYAGRVQAAITRSRYIEFTAPDADKGRALGMLCAEAGIDRGDVIAFGDGGNDVTMLQYAGIGYAVENAREQVKALADRIAPPNTEDGVAQVIERLLAEGCLGA